MCVIAITEITDDVVSLVREVYTFPVGLSRDRHILPTDLVFMGRESPVNEASQVTFANHGFRMSVPKATTIQATRPRPPNRPFS
jgi:hypothetical protein